MSFRFSLYCIPRETVDKYRNITNEEYRNSENVYRDLTSETIMYDSLTDILMYDPEEKFSSRLFTNKLEIECDMSFQTISKEQLLRIIEDVRMNHIVKWFDERRIDDNEKLGPAWDANEWHDKWNVEDALRANQGEWNFKANKWKTSWFDEEKGIKGYLNINIDPNNKWLVSGSWSYEYVIFDLIHILKIFDWENDVLVAIGG